MSSMQSPIIIHDSERDYNETPPIRPLRAMPLPPPILSRGWLHPRGPAPASNNTTTTTAAVLRPILKLRPRQLRAPSPLPFSLTPLPLSRPVSVLKKRNWEERCSADQEKKDTETDEDSDSDISPRGGRGAKRVLMAGMTPLPPLAAGSADEYTDEDDVPSEDTHNTVLWADASVRVADSFNDGDVKETLMHYIQHYLYQAVANSKRDTTVSSLDEQMDRNVAQMVWNIITVVMDDEFGLTVEIIVAAFIYVKRFTEHRNAYVSRDQFITCFCSAVFLAATLFDANIESLNQYVRILARNFRYAVAGLTNYVKQMLFTLLGRMMITPCEFRGVYAHIRARANDFKNSQEE